jgi:SagB-type dehydrogenase family enzyme
LVAHNYASGKRVAAPALALELLDFCSDWRTFGEVVAEFQAYPRAPLRRLVSLLVKHALLERSAAGTSGAVSLLDTWRRWPEAAFFHFATKDVRYGQQHEMDDRLVEKAATDPQPPPIKSYSGNARTRLPGVAAMNSLGSVLRQRRSWRRFGTQAIELSDMATLLGLTWGVQHWVQTRVGPCALKTSPSGGARHGVEAYLLARRVKGLAAGCYYYDPDAHELVCLKAGLSATRLEQYVSEQSCYRDASALVIMSAVFARAQWRYESSRAYRVVLLDAGHLGQTFCLVATALGLAPFCTAALADSLIEQDLGLDGVSESVIYSCGVGPRPPGVEWAPWPDTEKVPPLAPPKSRRSS